jgi:hypothetical protein
MCDRVAMLAENRADVVAPPKPAKKLNASRSATRALDERLKHDRRSPDELANDTLGKRRARQRHYVLLRLSGNSTQNISVLTGINLNSVTSALREVNSGGPGMAFELHIEMAKTLNLTVPELSAVASLRGNFWVGSGGQRYVFPATKKGGLAHLR